MPDPGLPTLLYVEDEIMIQTGVIASLEEAGFNLLVADDGQQALQLVEAHHRDLRGLITDINLGDGPDGWEVARAARQRVAGMPIVYVSAASDRDWAAQGVPGSVMVAKPFAPAQLVVAISSLLVVSDSTP